MGNLIGLAAITAALCAGRRPFVADYVWPLNNSMTPNEMDTSFGPRINKNKWDFHDGIDLPAPIGTKIYAVRTGVVHHAGPGGTGGYSSRHVVLEVNDPNDGPIYIVYVHLDSIDQAVTIGASVSQGQEIGTVGDDDATYPHLHIEFRKGTHRQIGSVHPLGYLPYTDTPNLTAIVPDRFNRLGEFMAARLRFGASSRLEGDLKRVEVDLKARSTLLETRVVDLDDKASVNEGNGDEYTYVNNIGVEGYQKSNMAAHGRTDLQYGILVRHIPTACDTLVARAIDVSHNVATSAEIGLPNQKAMDEYVDFEDGEMPPSGWKVVTSTSGSGTTVANRRSAGRRNSRGMLSRDASTTETRTQRAGIEYTLPAGRFEWVAEAWFKPTKLDLGPDQSVYLLYFLSGTKLSVAARINSTGSLRAGIVVEQPDGTLEDANSPVIIVLGVWRKWRLHLLRIGTRETTAVLYLNKGRQFVEQTRINWDSTTSEPTSLRAGIGLTSPGARATVLTHELRLTETADLVSTR
jgi:hypothetical protein